MTGDDGFRWGTDYPDDPNDPGPVPAFYQAEEPYERTWQPIDLTAVLAEGWTPPVPTVAARSDKQPCLYPGRLHTLAAESEAGKTWLALCWGRDELDADNHVVYVDFEDNESSIVGRLLAQGTGRDKVRDQFHYIRPGQPVGTGIHRDDLRTTLTQRQPTLVILDGVTEAMMLHGLDGNSNHDVAEFSRLLPRLIVAATNVHPNGGAAVLALDNVTKSAEHRGRYALGAVHKLNGVDGAAFILEAIRPFRIGTTGRSRLRIAKDRPGQLRRQALPALDDTGMDWFADLIIDSHDDTFVEVNLDAPDPKDTATPSHKRPTVYMKRVSEVLESVNVSLSQRQLLDRVAGKAEHIRSALAALIDEGLVETSPGAHGATLHALIRPFEEDVE